MTDQEYMQIAIDISKKAKFPYGAIVVLGGRSLAEVTAQQ